MQSSILYSTKFQESVVFQDWADTDYIKAILPVILGSGLAIMQRVLIVGAILSPANSCGSDADDGTVRVEAFHQLPLRSLSCSLAGP